MDAPPAEPAPRTGTWWYIGHPETGKTTLARAHWCRDMVETGWPGIVLDTVATDVLDDVPRARTIRELCERVFDGGLTTAYTPGTDARAEGDAVFRAVLAVGRCCLLVDEGSYYLSARRGGGGPLLRLQRAHRHVRVRVRLTTQHFSADVPQEALSCAPTVHLFRCSSPVVLDRIEREWGVERARILALRQGEHLLIETGFPRNPQVQPAPLPT